MRYQAAPRPGAHASLGEDSVRSSCEHVFVIEQPDSFRCSRCRAVKPSSDFSMRGSSGGRPDTYSRPCRAAYGKQHYAVNREVYIAQTRVRNQKRLRERVEFLLEYFESHPCA